MEKDGFHAALLAGTITSQWMDVTPEMALRWLENNFRNRKLSDDVVAAYARDMRNGVWVPTHQGVAFNDRDELIDGQHRLRAIVLSGKTIKMMVTFGLPSVIEGAEMTTMDAVDRGRTRSVAHQLKIQHGLKHGTLISGICFVIANLCYGKKTRRMSVGQTLDIYRMYEHAVTWVIAHRPRQQGLRVNGVLGAFCFALQTEEGFVDGSTPISLMFERLTDGVEFEAGSAIGRLHAFLTSEEATLMTRPFDRGVAELALNAIYLERMNERIEKLPMGTQGADHYRALQQDRVKRIAAMFELGASAE